MKFRTVNTLEGLPAGTQIRDRYGDTGTIIPGGLVRYHETRDLSVGYANRYGPFRIPVLTPAERRAAVLAGFGGLWS